MRNIIQNQSRTKMHFNKSGQNEVLSVECVPPDPAPGRGLTWFIMEDFRPRRLSGKRKRLLLLPSSDSDLTNFSLSPFSFSCSFCRHFFLRLRRSLALLELSLDISEELHDRWPPPSSSTASSDTVPAEVAMAAGCRGEAGGRRIELS